MNLLEKIFIVSCGIFIFMCGTIIGKNVEQKENRITEQIAYEEDLSEEKIIADRPEGLKVYFDTVKEGEIVFIVKNNTGNKLQEISIMNLEINGKGVNSYSDLSGIKNETIKKCFIEYDIQNENNIYNDILQLTGNLYIRGSQNYFHQKIDITWFP